MANKQELGNAQKPFHWASAWVPLLAFFSLLTAIGSLWTADSAEKTQTIQSEPYLTLEAVTTAPGKTPNAGGTPTSLDTSVTIKNSGQTNAVNLTFKSLAWYSVESTQQTSDRYGSAYHHRAETQLTSQWQVSPPTDSLDRDQPTIHFFPLVPQMNEPQGAVDYLYIQAEYDDEFPFPFRRHHITQFCIKKFPQEEDLGPVHNTWNRSPLADCLPGYKDLTASIKNGPSVGTP